VSRFGELEATVMDHLWDAGAPRSVRDILEALQRERTIAHTTVTTETLAGSTDKRATLVHVTDRVSPHEATQLLQALSDRNARRGR
jgi:uncharacterized protein YutE (UPF0331/DUF86 family)